MARGRFLGKRLAMSEKVAKTDDRSGMIYFLSYPHADRDGRLPYDPKEFAGACFSRIMLDFRWTIPDVVAARELLLGLGLWDWPGGPFVVIRDFAKNQEGMRYDRETPSIWDTPSTAGPHPANAGPTPATAGLSPQTQKVSADNCGPRPAQVQGNSKFKNKEKEEVQGAPRPDPPLGISGARRQEAGLIVNDVVRDFQKAHPNGSAVVVGKFDRDAIVDAAHVLVEMSPTRRVEIFRRSLATLPPAKQTLQDAIRAMNNPEVMGNGKPAAAAQEWPHDRGLPCLCPKCCAERDAKELANAK